jgi:SAM-dependent methyltransferase
MMTQHLAALCDTLDVVEGSQRYIAAAQKLVARASGLREKVTRASGLRNQSNRKRDARATVAFHHALFEEFEPPRKYDVIIASGILHEIENPQRVLKKAAGWLKPGGILHANVPNAFSLHRRIGVAMGALKDCRDFSERDRAFGHFRVYDRPLLRRHVERAGLRITQQGGIFLKPLSNAQMMEWKPELLEAFFAVGKSLPDLCAEIYINARKS